MHAPVRLEHRHWRSSDGFAVLPKPATVAVRITSYGGSLLSQLHVNQIMGVLRRTFEGLIDLTDVAHLDPASRTSVFLSRALASFTVAQLAALEPAEAAQAVTDGSGDNSVDAIHYDRATKTLYVVQ